MPNGRTMCDGCGNVFDQAPGRGRRRRYCMDCRPVQVQRGRLHGWDVDRVALAKACEHLGITKPVHVKRSPGQSRRGSHHGVFTTASGKLHRYCDPTVQYHAITVAANATPEEASRTLWHELTHAVQCERDPQHKARYSRYLRANGGKRRAYYSCPWEIEARASENLHDEIGALIVQTGPDSGWIPFDTEHARQESDAARRAMADGIADVIARLESQD